MSLPGCPSRMVVLGAVDVAYLYQRGLPADTDHLVVGALCIFRCCRKKMRWGRGPVLIYGAYAVWKVLQCSFPSHSPQRRDRLAIRISLRRWFQELVSDPSRFGGKDKVIRMRKGGCPRRLACGLTPLPPQAADQLGSTLCWSTYSNTYSNNYILVRRQSFFTMPTNFRRVWVRWHNTREKELVTL